MDGTYWYARLTYEPRTKPILVSYSRSKMVDDDSFTALSTLSFVLGLEGLQITRPPPSNVYERYLDDQLGQRDPAWS